MSDKERDELAELIANAEYPNMDPPWSERKDRSPVKWYSRKYADAVIADGWTKTRRITTAEELDALAFASVVLDDDGDVYRSGINNGETAWWQAGPQGMFRTVALPATVLWEPTA